MEYLDDFPTRDNNHEIQELAETAFRNAVSNSGGFLIQKEDRRDYGTDFQLEVISKTGMTNIRIHIQVKGTCTEPLKDSSVSLSVARRNLNYLLQQPNSIYVCFHIPSKRLLVRYVDDVFQEYEHQGIGWRSQQTVTVNFAQLFDLNFQQKLKESTFELGRISRNERILFTVTPPEQIIQAIEKNAKKVIVHNNESKARIMIHELYNAGEDDVISNSFDMFRIQLQASPKDMMLAYMAEINLGVDGFEINKKRIRDGIELLKKNLELGDFETGTLLYSIGNGWMALKEYEKARDTYNAALAILDCPKTSKIAAQCYKNMGGVMEYLSSDKDVAVGYYKRALKLDPRLNEAHFALALHYRNNQEFNEVLNHLDHVVFMNSDNTRYSSVQGWRIEAFFNVGEYDCGFREINSLIRNGATYGWIWPWCAKNVSIFGMDSIASTKKAIKFWELFIANVSESIDAKQQRLLCFMNLKFEEVETNFSFEEFKNQALEIIRDDNTDTAFWYDRIGHWAQCDNNWKDAVAYYSKAYELEPESYGYCFGTALNSLGQYSEAQPILIEQAEKHHPDAQSWFQVAIASEGIGDIAACLYAYNKALLLDPQYDLAWFNLGGIYWNLGACDEAVKIWKQAVERFPKHELIEQLPVNLLD